jgi:hypothetical protein
LNSIQKDSAGNYLISTRHYSTIFYLSPAGEILWELGGRNSSFQMGEGIEFFWQHDARWIDEGTRLRYVYNTQVGRIRKTNTAVYSITPLQVGLYRRNEQGE